MKYNFNQNAEQIVGVSDAITNRLILLAMVIVKIASAADKTENVETEWQNKDNNAEDEDKSLCIGGVCESLAD